LASYKRQTADLATLESDREQPTRYQEEKGLTEILSGYIDDTHGTAAST
jgi:hypothetical protein